MEHLEESPCLAATKDNMEYPEVEPEKSYQAEKNQIKLLMARAFTFCVGSFFYGNAENTRYGI